VKALLVSASLIAVYVIRLVTYANGDEKAELLVTEWASANGWTLINLAYPFQNGSFKFSSRKNQHVFRVTLRDSAGEIATAVRCGSWFVGMLSAKLNVNWLERETSASHG
jgi:hypothetical protein